MADAKTKSDDTITCNIKNSLPGARVIYDGIEGSQKQIHVAPGETKRNVTIHKSVADELRARNRAKRGSDLEVLPLSDDGNEKPAGGEKPAT